jgi:hypothetical protein
MSIDLLLNILLIIGGIGGILILSGALWALFARRDRRYREKYRRRRGLDEGEDAPTAGR